MNRKFLILALLALACNACVDIDYGDREGTLSVGDHRKTAFAIVSSAENSTIDYTTQYGYIEDIGDGRGYTAGLIGFTSATGDLLDVVERYCSLRPADNSLAAFLSALQDVNGTDSHNGLGQPFIQAWQDASADPLMRQAQNDIIDSLYLLPAVGYAKADGLTLLGQFIYYDAMVMHGPGDDEDSFNGIRTEALRHRNCPSEGGDENRYLRTFLDARRRVMHKEEAHSDLSRINAQRNWLKQGNYNLTLPLHWTMYGDSFTLTQTDIDAME